MGEPALEPSDPTQRALELAYRQLGRRDRTESELRGHLEDRGVAATCIAEVVRTLVAGGHLDDARYARRFAEDRRSLDQWGPERIARRLIAAGVDPDLVDATIADFDAQAELDAALALLRRRYDAPLRNPAARRRALGVLVRRGYGLEAALDAIRAHASTPAAR